MSVKYIPKKYESTYDINSIPRGLTVMHNDLKDTIKTFTTEFYNRNLDVTLYVTSELIISGCFDKIYNHLVHYYFNDVNLANLQFLPFLSQFNKYYQRYDYKIKKSHPLLAVNDQVIRNFAFFAVSILSLSKNNKLIKLPKIEIIDLDLQNKKKQLVSKNLTLVNMFLKEDDSKHIIVPLSEICNYLYDTTLTSREQMCVYWYSWLLSYEKTYHNSNMIVATRLIDGIDVKYTRDFIWIIWTIIKYFSNKHILPYINYLYDIFITNYSRSFKRSKANIIVMAFMLVINPFPKITYPITPMDDKIYCTGVKNSLKVNLYFLKIFQEALTKNI